MSRKELYPTRSIGKRGFLNDFFPTSGETDYYSKTLGYVIEGVSFGNSYEAISHLIETCDMTNDEAASYCSRLVKAYGGTREVRAVEGALMNA